MKKGYEYLIIVGLLLPLFFINIKSSHDWGDDFAQYIHQAQNLLEGVSQNETGYVFNPNEFIGPQAYPVGFPLLLAPVIAACGINYTALTLYMSLFFVAAFFVGFLYFRKYFSFVVSSAIIFIIAYNPIMLGFKTEVLSDMPFLFFVMTILLLQTKKQTIPLIILTALLAGFTMQIRTVGVTLVASILIYQLYNLYKNNTNRKQSLANLVLFLVPTLLIYFGIKLAIPAESNYINPFEYRSILIDAINNFSYHQLSFQLFFSGYKLDDYYFILTITSACLTCLTIIGLLWDIKLNNLKLPFIFMCVYGIAISVFKYNNTGLRFVLPCLFILFYFCTLGLKQILTPLITNKNWLPLFFVLVISFSYHQAWATIYADNKKIQDGPEKPEALAFFNFIKENTLPTDLISFDKPRVLSLYTQRPSIYLNPKLYRYELTKEFMKYKVTYWAVCSSIYSNNHFLIENDTTIYDKKVFDNGYCKLYKLKPSYKIY